MSDDAKPYKFSYTAKGTDGRAVSGTVEAADVNIVKEILQRQGLSPLIIKPIKTGFDPNNLHLSLKGSKKVKSKDLVIFTRQLSTMINAGVPLVRSLSTLQSQTANKALKEVSAQVAHDVEGGLAFADALAKHPKVFSEVYVNMVRAGEAGGIMDDILDRLAAQQEKESSMKKKIKSASSYPMVLVFITIAAFFGMMLVVIPKIGKIVTDLAGPDAELPVYTKIMLGLSSFIVHQWYLFAIIFIGGTFGIRWFIKTPKGKYLFHQLLLKVPVVKTIVSKVAIARFSRTFASLMTSGVSVLDALDVTGKAIGNVVIQKELAEAAKAVKNGHQLSEPLSTSPNFPPIVSQMLAIGEETGQVDTVLLKVADFYEEEVDAVIDSLASIIEPVMIVILGGMVGLIAASVMGPIASLAQKI